MKRKLSKSSQGRYVKRRRVTSAKSVRRIARRAALSVAETKNRVYDSSGITIKKNDLNSWNVMYSVGMTRGTGHDDVIGDEIYLKGIKLAFEVSTTLDETLQYQIAVIKTDKMNTVSSLAYGDVSHNDSAFADLLMLDRDKCQVLFQKTGRLTQTGPSGTRHAHLVQKYIKINKKAVFRNLDLSTELKYYNYYVLAYAYTYSGTAGTTSIAQIIPQQLRVYWKDC